MHNHTPGHDLLNQSKRTPISLRLIPIVAFLVATVAMFLLGCFVIGPWYRSHNQSIETSMVPPSVVSDADGNPLPLPTRPSCVTSGDEITIKEITPDEPDPVTAPDDASKSPDLDLPAHQTTSASTGQADIPSLTSPDTVDAMDAGKSEPPLAEPKASSESDAISQPLHRVRAGLFSDRANADTLSAKLSSAGYSPAVYHIERDGRQLYAVQLGAFRKRQSADELARSLRESGFEVFVVVDK